MEQDSDSSSPCLAEDPCLMTLNQLAAYLQVSEATIKELVRERKIPCHKVVDTSSGFFGRQCSRL